MLSNDFLGFMVNEDEKEQIINKVVENYLKTGEDSYLIPRSFHFTARELEEITREANRRLGF